MVQSVLDVPMAVVEDGRFLRSGPLRPQRGKAEDGLDGDFPGADDVSLMHDAEGMVASRQGGQFVQVAIQGDGRQRRVPARPCPFSEVVNSAAES